jgi:molybdenum cofactor synthesis domain-containing protein
VKPGQNVRLRGEDVSDGERVLQAGQVLDINARTLLHAIGVGEVAVVARPKAAVIATGKELVTEAAQTLESGQIRDSNRPYLVGRLQAAGAEVVWQGTVGDEVAAFNAVLDEALDAGAQLLISTGAVSAGRYDFIPDALRGRGARIVFHKVAIRPGKPLLFAVLPNGALYFGLPGNPVSAAVGQRFFVEPVLRRLLGLAPEQVLMPLQADVRTPPGLRFHARARVEVDAQGRLSARVLAGQESFRLMSMLQANAWVVLEARAVWPCRHASARAGLGSSGPGAAGEPGVMMRQVNLQLFGAFSDLDASREIAVDVAGGTVADLRQALRELLPLRWPGFRAGLLDYSAFADQQRVLRDHEALPDDGRVAILPPVSGG